MHSQESLFNTSQTVQSSQKNVQQKSEQKMYLPTELTEVLGVLRNLHLLDLLTQTGTIPSTIFANNSSLLGALRLSKHCKNNLVTQLVDKL
jgi:hypothetical protein